MASRWLAVLLVGCAGIVTDARPGSRRPISVLLYAGDDPASRAAAAAVLASYPRVTIEPVVELAKSVQLGILPDGCVQAHARGHDYFAIAGFEDKHRFDEVCDDTGLSPLIDPKHRCKTSHHENQSTSSTFAITFYRADNCRETNEVRIVASGWAKGPPETSKPEARAAAIAKAHNR